MATRLSLAHDERTRAKIQTSQLINRLQDHAKGKVEMSPTQVKAAEILIRKTLPDLTNVTLAGDKNAPLQHKVELSFRSGV